MNTHDNTPTRPGDDIRELRRRIAAGEIPVPEWA